MPRIEILAEGMSIGTDVGTIGFCAVLLVEGDKRILFDTAHVGRRTYIEAQLQARGLSPGDIDAQFLSHAHWDHAQNFDLFPNAPLLIHPRERQYAQRPHRNDWATPQWTGAALATHTLEEVAGGDQLMPGCRVIELPGHSPGSMGLEVETDAGRCIITGDAIHNAGVAQRGQSPLVFWSAEQADASIRTAVERADILYPGHDRPFRLRDDKIEYLTDFAITLSNIVPGTAGATFVESPPPAPRWVMPGIEEQRLD